MRRPDAQSSPSPTESPIVAWLTGAAVKQAIAKAARSLRLLAAEGKPEDFISQVASLVEENALLKSDNAVLRNEIASLAKRLDKVRAELDAIKRAVARGLNKEDFEFSSHRSIIDEIVGKGYGHKLTAASDYGACMRRKCGRAHPEAGRRRRAQADRASRRGQRQAH
jgi:hypothetical protein